MRGWGVYLRVCLFEYGIDLAFGIEGWVYPG